MTVAVKEEVKVAKKQPARRIQKVQKYKNEKWAKARFTWLEMAENPGLVWKISPQGQNEEFKDGEVYERKVAFFEMLNNECRRPEKEMKKRGNGDLGELRTVRYIPRIRFDIINTYDKKIPIKDEEED